MEKECDSSHLFFTRLLFRITVLALIPSLTLVALLLAQTNAINQQTINRKRNMQVAIEPNVLFWDRLDKLSRTKVDGEVVLKGSTTIPLNKIRIWRGERGGFLTIHCVMQELVRANIRSWPSSVSEDGLTVGLWLHDFSMERNGYRRKFELSFFDGIAAERFFDVFVDELPTSVTRGPSYYEMKDGCEDNDEEDLDDSEAQEEEENDDDCSSKSTEENDGNRVGEAEDNEEDKLKFILELDDNWGESQSLFNPSHPPQN